MVMMRYLLACLSLSIAGGCAVCASPHDCKYAAFGGVRERTDHVHGRVGSVFDAAAELNHVVSQPSHVPPDATGGDSQDTGDATNGEDNGSIDEGDEGTPRRPGVTLPELPEPGRIELPELPESVMPEDRPLLEAGIEPARSATRNPLSDLLTHEFQ